MSDKCKNTGNFWEKWDLHLHSPASLFNNQYGINNQNEDKIWNNFVTMIEKNDISVIGITDYYSVEGYKKMLQFKKKGRLKNIKAIFPNIEIRLDNSLSSMRFVNYHVIFSPDISVDEIEKSFLEKLTFKCGEKNYSFTKHDICQLGSIFAADKIEQNIQYKNGVEQFKVNINSMMEILESNFKGKYFTVAAADNDDGVNNLISDKGSYDILSPNQGWATRSNILKFTDALFTTNHRTIKVFSGQGNDREKIFVREKLGGVKPCFEESDAHGFEEQFGKRWTWIKAEPSFDGLLQTKFEPVKRVKEQRYSLQNPLEISGNKYIKYLKINSPKDIIQPVIAFNPGLNTIIGGKSSGKSLLLYQIVKSLNIDLTDLEGTSILDYKGLDLSSMSILGNDEQPKEGFSVEYYPQLYINRISEDFKNKKLQDIINERLSNLNISSELDQINQLKQTYSDDIREKIIKYSNCSEQICGLLIENNKLGRIEDIKKNIDSIDNKYVELIAELNISNKENKLYKELNKNLENLHEQQKEVVVEINSKKEELQQIDEFTNQFSNIYNELLNESLQDKLRNSYNLFLSNLKSLERDIENKIQNKINEKLLLEKKQARVIEEMSPITKKLNRREELKKNRINRQQLLDAQTKCLDNKKKIKTYQIEQTKLLNSMKSTLKNTVNSITSLAKKCDNYPLSSSLNLKLKLVFDSQHYNNQIFNLFDQRKISKALLSGVLDNEYVYGEGFIEKWFNFIKSSLNNKYSDFLRKNVDNDILLNNLCFLPILVPKNITKENDSLDRMSPGKRALVVLELLLEGKGTSENPILIDQPEDNLDNRSISRELVTLLRKVSLKRQVIIVTHNANLVVLADADEVIVANQDPEVKENKQYQFEYITGSLENSGKLEDGKLASRGIRRNITDILEGGEEAFKVRERKYLIN